MHIELHYKKYNTIKQILDDATIMSTIIEEESVSSLSPSSLSVTNHNINNLNKHAKNTHCQKVKKSELLIFNNRDMFNVRLSFNPNNGKDH